MKRLASALAVMAVLVFAVSTTFAQADQARVRVVHASPDAPAVDVLVDGNRAFSGIEYRTVTPYAPLAAGSYQVQVVPAGAMDPAVLEVINENLDLEANTDTTVIASGRLDDITPLVLIDDNTPPANGKAKVRFVHLAPDAPAVDIAVAGGPVLFSNISFRGVGDYVEVDAGSYDVEVRAAGTNDVVLTVPGVAVDSGTIYTVYAMGLVGEEPALEAVVSVDSEETATSGAATTAASALPESGEGSMLGQWAIGLILIGAAVLAGGFALRRQSA